MDENKSLVPAGRADLIPETQNMVTLAKYLHESKMFPNAGSVAGIMTIMEYGRELGIPPVAALSTMQNIRGRLTMEAKAMLAVGQKNAGVSWKIDELNDKVCRMTFMRPGFSPTEVTFTEEEARTAGLLTKDSWKLYRQDMLFARCASRGIRRVAPDAVLGLYSIEEMRDVEAVDSAKKDLDGGARPVETEPVVFDGEDEVEEKEPGEFDEPVKVEPPPQEKPKVDEDLNRCIEDVKHELEAQKIDGKDFKEWLVGQGKKMNRHFVGSIFGKASFTRGSLEDIKYLITVLPKAIALYRAEKGGAL